MAIEWDKLVEFPSVFSFRVMGVADAALADRVVAAVQPLAPGDYVPSVKPSKAGNYFAVAINVTVTSKEHVESLYRALGAVEGVRMVL